MDKTDVPDNRNGRVSDGTTYVRVCVFAARANGSTASRRRCKRYEKQRNGPPDERDYRNGTEHRALSLFAYYYRTTRVGRADSRPRPVRINRRGARVDERDPFGGRRTRAGRPAHRLPPFPTYDDYVARASS